MLFLHNTTWTIREGATGSCGNHGIENRLTKNLITFQFYWRITNKHPTQWDEEN